MELKELRTMNYAVAEETVLELAAGAGDTGFEAAAILGDEGRLICTDFSPRMLDAARRRGAELGIESVDYRCAHRGAGGAFHRRRRRRVPGVRRRYGGADRDRAPGRPGDERAQIEARLREAFAPFATTGGYALPGVVLAAVAS